MPPETAAYRTTYLHRDTVPLRPSSNGSPDDVAPVTGPLADGAFTNDRTLISTAAAKNGSTVTIYDNGVAIGTALVTDGTGRIRELSEASHALTFSATDNAGNTAQNPAVSCVRLYRPPAPTVQTVDGGDGTRVAGLPRLTLPLIHHAD